MTENPIPEKYKDRIVDPERNQILSNICSIFIEELNQEMSQNGIDYRFAISGSIGAGFAVHLQDNKLTLNDIDFTINRADPEVADPITDAELASFVKSSIWLQDRVKQFLNGPIYEFVTFNGIRINNRDVDIVLLENAELVGAVTINRFSGMYLGRYFGEED